MLLKTEGNSSKRKESVRYRNIEIIKILKESVMQKFIKTNKTAVSERRSLNIYLK